MTTGLRSIIKTNKMSKEKEKNQITRKGLKSNKKEQKLV